ncbi:hypothetical protein Q7C_1337 [Methylophaga frappieri]|uniref:Heme chaperone HemW n=1 Tax=Methylophaga frappieri (strain ATCC BAA-2434 / DSM 25690 / JAM7) TaxID=754477 RepID=I1YHU4_METFJ|nr:radical SAM family heme chaperone HemW [Methylophaga frappieri]AFJ02487.1 hypothetical protein Q7C_1337 [Methylophaga frappieri]
MFHFTTLPPLSLYIHVPWCVRKCPYCDFNSHHARDTLPEKAYVQALLADLEQELPLIWGRTVNSIFIGGGTPSLFSAEAYDQLFSGIRSLLPLRADAEITLEANPGTFEAARFHDYRQLGINRLSIGIQSFDNNALMRLGRIHDGEEAKRAVEIARLVGFENLNLDLMFGLPGQTAVTAEQDVKTAIDLAPTHISYYQLTIEPNTLFYQQPPDLPEDDPIIDWQEASQQRLAQAGYQQYEVSAYAQSGKACRHNLNYWQFGDYIGIGAGAHGKISDAAQQTITRRLKHKQPQAYMDKTMNQAGLFKSELLNVRDIGFEFMLNALRLTEGFETRLFQQRTGIPLKHLDKALQIAETENLLHYDIHRICPTEKGRRYLNTLIELFLPE